MEIAFPVISIIIENAGGAVGCIIKMAATSPGAWGLSLQRTQEFDHLHCDGCPGSAYKCIFRASWDALTAFPRIEEPQESRS